MKHLNDPLPLPRQIDASIPEAFERVLLKALAKQPEQRFQSAGEMAQALRGAAEKAGVKLPERVSFPLSFTTKEAPAESVAVFSGTSRAKMGDAQFADADTDTTLSQKLGAERERITSDPGRPVAVSQERTARQKSDVAKVIVTVVALIVTCNLITVMAGGVVGRSLFVRGWPMELLMATVLLSVIMILRGSIYLFIPVGLLLGHGLLFAYYSLTGNWNHWAFLWPLEPFLIGGTLLLTFWLAGRDERSGPLSRVLGAVAGAVAAAASMYVVWWAVLLG
jgi:hypothetical protein